MIIVLGLIILILIIGFVILRQAPKENIQYPSEQGKEEGGGISLEEKQFIESWILKNNLNQYGDPKDMVYIGGTPLFDESTGESIDKYEYILRNHPKKPWRE